MPATHLRLKIQLVCGDRFALGPGKADLLEAIAREASISGAARELGMSYRRAWVLVDEMNRCFTGKLVETLSGGGLERGARLTTLGAQALAAYRALQALGAELGASDPYRQIAALLRDAPLPKQPDQ
jgi:molybdate transport system regulatory protein